MVAITAWDPGVSMGAPSGTYGTTGGATIGQGGGSLNTISSGGSTYSLADIRYTGMKFNFSDLGQWDYAELAMKVVGGFGDVMSYKAENMAKELALDYQNLQATIADQERQRAGWEVFGDGTYNDFDLDPNTLKRGKYSPFGAELTYAICDAYPEIQLASFDYSDCIASKVSVDQMSGV
jgi:hypothetical protein